MRLAAVQMNATADVERNVGIAAELVAEAAERGAELIALPEKWSCLGDAEALRAAAEPLDGPLLGKCAEWAREHGAWLLAGSIVERAPDGETLHNTSVLLDPEGSQVAAYRKIHMFDVEVEGQAYRESETTQPGDDAPALADLGELRLGMSVCYDLRFPELYRGLAGGPGEEAGGGATLLGVPSAFTSATGRAHWEVLVRARAIENQCYVLAPNQVGTAPPSYDSWGHSLIVDPWGRVLADAGRERAAIAIAEVDPGELHEVRRRFPSLANRRLRGSELLVEAHP